MKTVLPLMLSFKGSRTYVQGGDLYNAIERACAKHTGRNFHVRELIIRNVARAQCELILGPDQPSGPAVKAVFSIAQDGESINGSVIETGQPINDRVPFDEAKIIELTQIDDDTILLHDRTGFTPIEEIIAMTKQLHQVRIPISQGRWIFIGIKLQRALIGACRSRVSLRIKKNLANRITYSDLHFDNSIVGQVNFAVAQL